MIIREDVEHTYFSGLNNSQERTSLRCEIKCDNPECGKTFYRPPSDLKKHAKQHYHYCKKKCQRTHYGICKVDGCEEKFLKYKSKSNMCFKHLKVYNRKTIKSELLELMGDACVCCGERDPMFLQVDHVFNDGHKDKKNMKHSLKSNDYLKIWNETPERIQLLCANCNHAKAKNGGVIYRPEKFIIRKLR